MSVSAHNKDYVPVNYLGPSYKATQDSSPALSPLNNKVEIKNNKTETNKSAPVTSPTKGGALQNNQSPSDKKRKSPLFYNAYNKVAKNAPAGEVLFSRSLFSGSLGLCDGQSLAPARTNGFKYKGETFPGIVTDAQGRIYLYDAGKEFHRRLKMVGKKAPQGVSYQIGFKLKGGSGAFIPLGRLEELQAVLRSADGGRNIVDISEEKQGFAANWMRAVSKNPETRKKYIAENAVRVRSKPVVAALKIGAGLGALALAGGAVAGWVLAGMNVFGGGEGANFNLSANETSFNSDNAVQGQNVTLDPNQTYYVDPESIGENGLISGQDIKTAHPDTFVQGANEKLVPGGEGLNTDLTFKIDPASINVDGSVNGQDITLPHDGEYQLGFDVTSGEPSQQRDLIFNGNELEPVQNVTREPVLNTWERIGIGAGAAALGGTLVGGGLAGYLERRRASALAAKSANIIAPPAGYTDFTG